MGGGGDDEISTTETAKLCINSGRVNMIPANICWSETIHGSIRVPILEFDLHVFNAIQNLGINPSARGVSIPKILELEGMAPPVGSRPLYPEYAKPVLATEAAAHEARSDALDDVIVFN